MSGLEHVRMAMRKWPKPLAESGRIIVPTHCLYPSNTAVNVLVEGGRNEFIVTDQGAAVDHVQAAGPMIDIARADRLLWHLVRPQKLKIERGIIYSPVVHANSLLNSIVLVANTSKEAAHCLMTHFKIPTRRTFRAELARILEFKFGGQLEKESQVAGASTKKHRFDYAVRLSKGKKLLIDTVTNDASSVNAKVVSNLDVRQAGYKDIDQRIIYDETEEWSAANLRLLQVGATLVPFGHARAVIERLAA